MRNINLLSVSNTRASVSALSSALRVMMSSFPAHFRIFDILCRNKGSKNVRKLQIKDKESYKHNI